MQSDDMLLKEKLPLLDDLEGDALPAGLPPVIDAHVHLFPDKLFAAVQAWFDRHGWPIRYRMSSDKVLEFLFAHGVERVVGLQFAHRPGMAAELNAYMLELCRQFPKLVGLATVFPGEPGAAGILAEAFAHGLGGVKLHVHVQGVAVDAPEMEEIYRVCLEHDKPLLIHAGREPNSPGYAHDIYQLCDAGRVEQVLRAHPGLRLCIPHLGMSETPTYARLLEEHDGLWLDTTMTLADYFPGQPRPDLAALRRDRVMYGSDFPNIPFAWDRELKALKAMDLNPEYLSMLLSANAREFYRIA